MANPVLNYPLQESGAGPSLALALKIFSGLVLKAYQTATVALQYAVKQTITEGNSYQFPATWKMDGAEHTAGTDLSGDNKPQTVERLINVDTKEYISHVWLDIVSQFISHYGTKEERAIQASRAIAREMDSRYLRCAARGAKASDHGLGSVMPGGVTKLGDAGSSYTTNWPISLAGSHNVQNDLAYIAQTFDEKNVPEQNRAAFLSPYFIRVLRQDPTLLSSDYQRPNDKLTRKMYMVEGFVIEKTNNMPTTGGANGDGDFSTTALAGSENTNYQGDFSKTHVICVGESAVGQVSFGGVTSFGPLWYPEKRSHLLGAVVLQGQNYLRPECCGSILSTN